MAIGGAGVVMTDLLAQLNDVCRSGDGWTARCPAHADRHNSLGIHHRDGRWLLKCHAGCGWREIINALGIEPSGLFDVGRCGWEARSLRENERIVLGKIWIDAAHAITVEVTS
jgi:hypothetical protein